MSWAHLQSTGSQNGGAASLAATYAGAVAVGSLLVAAVNFNDTAGTITATCADGVNGAWSVAIGPTRNASMNSGWTQYIFYKANTGAGTPTVTITLSATSGPIRLTIGEYSGIAAATPLDQVSGAAAGSDAPNSGNVTTTANNELIYGAAMTLSTDTTAAGGLTSRFSIDGFGRVADKNGPTAGVFSAAFTCTAQWWICQVATFKEPTVAFMPKSFQSQRMAVKRASFY